ncbi:aspartate aminotransferase family protein [Rhodopila sp.]|uniref:aspartate aminotransferase family protein n=1 Tax=Rhodopila sp. TaxID=2480087 RepID=UPI002CDEBFB7|nr:aminotransferase class III-fold pyridoxal phosphate-dependent enzyme [Rhodopila sp.]HVZ09607.1 aminotransferase class III-fold pyridoxal phosphate-dependent enzyme [Rhodopila sp.]
MSDTALRNADIDAALAEAKEAYVARNPNSLARYVEATTVMPGGNTRTVLHYAPFPVAMVRAEGCRMWDADGAEYTDFLGEYTAGLYGHSHPVIRAAVDKALDNGISLGAANMTEARFARAVTERFGLERVRFTNSGTEANLLALSTARIFTRRPKVMVFDGGYHGAVFGFAGGGSPINVPFDYVLARYNDIEATRALVAAHADSLAVVILEPMIGSGGCIPASGDFLRMLRAEATRIGALLIFDEVMTSRLAPGGLQSVVGVKPDLTTLGKYIGGGMSFGAFGGRAEIMELFDPRRPDALPHAGTFNNNVLTMSAGLAGLTEIYTPDAALALNRRGDALRDRLNALCAQAGAPMQFTGIGSMLAVHFTRGAVRSPADAAAANQKLKELFFFDLLAHGIWLARRGMMTVSLPIGDAECDRLAGAVQEFLAGRRSLLV